MAQGQYDHPSYITRQMEYLGVTTAGANGTSLKMAFPTTMRLRRFTSTVIVAGTSAGAGVNFIALNGTTTTTLGSIITGTGVVNSVIQGADFNYTLPTGGLFYLTNGTDATGTVSVVGEYHLDPVLGTWSTP